MSDCRTRTRVEWRLFLAAFVAFAFFHQGGGWAQNARFAQVRAIVEEGRFTIDSYLFYWKAERTENGYRLLRTPMVDGGFVLRKAQYALLWPGEQELQLNPAIDDAAPGAINRVTATGDLSYADGHLYPKFAPGTALLAVPGYFVIYHAERLVGLDPDDWWVLTVNSWLASALGVGLLSAIGCILFLRVALILWRGRLRPAIWATLAFAFGTIFFPFATLLYENNVVAVTLLGAFYFILREREVEVERTSRGLLLLAGAAAGFATLSAYGALVPALFLGGYLLARGGRNDRWLWFGLGLAGPLLFLGYYHWTCFGTPFTTSYRFQNPQLFGAGGWLNGMGLPRFDGLVGILVSPFRGLFFSSPVLLIGVAGLVALWRSGKRLEGLLCASTLVYFVALNSCLSDWHGGWSFGPRHLLPAVPFLALGVTFGFARMFKTTLALATLSALMMLAHTAVDARSPVGSTTVARVPDRAPILRDPLTEYTLPIFLTGKPWPILDAQIEAAVARTEERMREQGVGPDEFDTRLAEYREGFEDSARDGGRDFAMALYVGPVSANPIGIYEAWIGRIFRPGEPQLAWNSFNAGEFLAPSSRFSLLLLLGICLPLAGAALDLARGPVEKTASPAESEIGPNLS